MSIYGIHEEDREESILNLLPEASLLKVKKVSSMQWMNPMIPRLVYDYFSHSDWIYERMFEGERVMTYLEEGKVALCDTKGGLLNKRYPEIAEEIAAIDDIPDCIFDGVIVAFEGALESNERLKKRKSIKDRNRALESEVEVFYYIFDCIYCDGYDLREVPLLERKKLLHRMMDWEDPIRFLPHIVGEGERYFEEACEKGFSGVIAKDSKSQYIGRKSMKWRKFKC